ncbi:unnamed protein product [Amoebophrya sp. A120]|nr:unnamed protein product [Amoebophrya sp. A120]|eukprot:GSA120T00024073001.1
MLKKLLVLSFLAQDAALASFLVRKPVRCGKAVVRKGWNLARRIGRINTACVCFLGYQAIKEEFQKEIQDAAQSAHDQCMLGATSAADTLGGNYGGVFCNPVETITERVPQTMHQYCQENVPTDAQGVCQPTDLLQKGYEYARDKMYESCMSNSENSSYCTPSYSMAKVQMNCYEQVNNMLRDYPEAAQTAISACTPKSTLTNLYGKAKTGVKNLLHKARSVEWPAATASTASTSAAVPTTTTADPTPGVRVYPVFEEEASMPAQ